jgi:hypothetical protein
VLLDALWAARIVSERSFTADIVELARQYSIEGAGCTLANAVRGSPSMIEQTSAAMRSSST